MEQDTGKFRTNTKDQYYTKLTVAKDCVDFIIAKFPSSSEYQWVEPSAGNGVFLKSLLEVIAGADKIGIDLDPKGTGTGKEIQQGDFLTWTPISKKKRIFFGNPPFGRQGCLAKAFIKHASQYADAIAFILPRSFVKPSMSRAFPLAFHCILSEELEKNAFEVNGEEYDVPCVFQIWEKRGEERAAFLAVDPEGFEYVKHGQPFHIAFKRAGGLAGKSYPASATNDYNLNYHYFLKLEDAYVPHIQKIIEQVNAHIFPSNTVGPRSLSKSEANEVLNRVLEGVIRP
jgi:hypothetical protein